MKKSLLICLLTCIVGSFLGTSSLVAQSVTDGNFNYYEWDSEGFAAKGALQVDYNNDHNGRFNTNGSDSDPGGGLVFGSFISGEGISSNRIGSNGFGPYNGLNFLTSHAIRMAITNSGNVGIGTATPTRLLDVGGKMGIFLGMNGDATFKGLGSGTWTRIGGNGSGLYFWGNNNVENDNNPQFAITGSGNIGIGTASPGAQLQIQDNSAPGTKNLMVGDDTFFTDIDQADILGLYGGFNSNQGGIKLGASGPTIFGSSAGNVGIGTTSPGAYRLAVEGRIGAREVEVKTGAWADFVFDPAYKLRPLEEVKAFITANGHLPEVPSEEDMIKNGNNLGKTDAILLQKIEELTLYIIELEQRLKTLEKSK